MKGLNVKEVAREQGVSINAIYSRVHCKWTLDEILKGFRLRLPRVMAHRYDYASGNTAFGVMVSDIVSALTGGDRWEGHLGAMVMIGLLEMKEV
jgi:hypothetical protein